MRNCVVNFHFATSPILHRRLVKRQTLNRWNYRAAVWHLPSPDLPSKPTSILTSSWTCPSEDKYSLKNEMQPVFRSLFSYLGVRTIKLSPALAITMSVCTANLGMFLSVSWTVRALLLWQIQTLLGSLLSGQLLASHAKFGTMGFCELENKNIILQFTGWTSMWVTCLGLHASVWAPYMNAVKQANATRMLFCERVESEPPWPTRVKQICCD